MLESNRNHGIDAPIHVNRHLGQRERVWWAGIEAGSRKPGSEMDPDAEGHLSLISFHNLTCSGLPFIPWNHNGASANARDRCGSRIN
jgi:hypothetical protein